jgi:uncharacterized protein YndB with AHSA1/START domain
MSSAQASQTISADPEAVWRMVSDVTRMGDWSPETTSCRWLDGADGPAVGARFRGSNARGPLRWTTTCTVTAAEPGRRFSFDVTYGPLRISTWSYEFARRDGGCEVTESWTDNRPTWMRLASIPVMAVADRAGHNRRGMEHTLAVLKRAAEA